MRKLALNDEILLKIEKPARYIGGEYNSVMKDPEKVAIRFAMCFPDVYEIGMSHLGIQILYDMFNRREDVWCERVYSPWVDLDKVMREEHRYLLPLQLLPDNPICFHHFSYFLCKYLRAGHKPFPLHRYKTYQKILQLVPDYRCKDRRQLQLDHPPSFLLREAEFHSDPESAKYSYSTFRTGL